MSGSCLGSCGEEQGPARGTDFFPPTGAKDSNRLARKEYREQCKGREGELGPRESCVTIKVST